MNRVFIMLLGTVAFGSLCSAHADTRVPGTKVSYNDRGIYIDERYDTVGKTYLALTCAGNFPQIAIYSKVTLASDHSPKLVAVNWAVDSTYFAGALGVVRRDRQAGHLGVWDMDKGAVYDVLGLVWAAQSSVSATVEQAGLSPVTYTFPTRGVREALRHLRCF